MPRIRDVMRGALPQGPLELVGEVLALWQRSSDWKLILLDAKNDSIAIEATLPLPSADSLPVEIGDLVAIEGEFMVWTDALFVTQFAFRGARVIENKGPSHRQNALFAELQRLRSLRRDPALIGRPLADLILVTSLGSKAIADFAEAFQGIASPVPRIEAVDLLNALSIERGIRNAAAQAPDLVVVTRGGGSSLDLLPFSTPEVIRAVADAAAHIPTIVAVGHSDDVTAAEEFASYRPVRTPSHAGDKARVLHEAQLRYARRAVAAAPHATARVGKRPPSRTPSPFGPPPPVAPISADRAPSEGSPSQPLHLAPERNPHATPHFPWKGLVVFVAVVALLVAIGFWLVFHFHADDDSDRAVHEIVEQPREASRAPAPAPPAAPTKPPSGAPARRPVSTQRQHDGQP